MTAQHMGAVINDSSALRHQIGARLGHELSDGEDKQHAGHASVDERDLGLVPG